MFLNSWRKWLNDRDTRGKRAPARRKPLRKPARRPEFERLEDRLAPASITFNGTNGDDALEVDRVTGGGTDSIQFLNNGILVDSRPLATVDSVTVNGLNGNDTLTVNYGASGGVFALPLTFHGGNPTTAPGDKLVVIG